MGLDDIVDQAKDLAGDAADEAKKLAGEAKDVAGDVADKAHDLLHGDDDRPTASGGTGF